MEMFLIGCPECRLVRPENFDEFGKEFVVVEMASIDVWQGSSLLAFEIKLPCYFGEEAPVEL